jgi:hypothetical protein
MNTPLDAVPFRSNSDLSHMQVAHMYAQRQKSFIAAIAPANGFATVGTPTPWQPASVVQPEVIAQPAMPAIPSNTIAKPDPPKFAEFLLTLLATTQRADAMIGDLNERFTRECREFSRASAVRLYWARTLHSLPPLVWRAIGKVVLAVVERFFGPGAA